MRDVEIVQKCLILLNLEFVEFMPDWQYYTHSISGIAVRFFRCYYNNLKIDLHLDTVIDDLLRSAYYGGRCEVFGNPSCGYIYHFDFTGMYTSRLHEIYPIDRGSYTSSPKKISDFGFYSVKVCSPKIDIPILPYRCPSTGKLLFPTGVFSGIYWGEELNLFIKNGGVILDVYWGYEYKHSGKPFIDFAEICTNLRKRGALAHIVWKLIPNSFIGRLGLKKDSDKTVIESIHNYNPLDPNIIYDKKINNFYIVKYRNTSSSKSSLFSNVAYAAITTAKARILWWTAAQDVISNGGRLLYCDTDSLFIEYKKNVTGESHGVITWDNKKDMILDDALFATNKAYAVKRGSLWEVKIKGVPKDSVSIDDFKNIYNNRLHHTITCDYFSKKNLIIDIKEVLKIINIANYDKRIWIDRTTTEPLYVNEDTLNK